MARKWAPWRLWVYGSEALMRQPDQEFRDNSYQAMFIAGGVAIVLASCIGFLFARNLVSPINRIMKTPGPSATAICRLAPS